MTLPNSGLISMQAINIELGNASNAAINLNEAAVRELPGIPSGLISLADFYGKSKPIANAGFAIFGGGSSGLTTSTNKYTYIDDTIAAGTALGLGTRNLAGTGNYTVGIFGGGYASNSTAYTDKYTYADNTRAATSTLGLARHGLAAAGNTSVGIFGGGNTDWGQGVANTAYADKYTYSNNTVAPGTALTKANYCLAATGNSTLGIFSGIATDNGAFYGAYTDKYTYANNTTVASTVLGNIRAYLAACGTSTIGIFGGGSYATNVTNYTDKYTYSNNTVAPGTVLLVFRSGLAAAGNSMVGIFTGGYNSIVTIDHTDKYTYTTNAVVSGTKLGTPRNSAAGITSAPGGF